MQDFRYGIEKISQGLRKFSRNPSKINPGHIFAMLAKIRCHCENLLS